MLSHDDKSFDLDFYYNDDSFEKEENLDEEQNFHVPSAIPAMDIHRSNNNTFGDMIENNGENYELTFKKDKALMFGSGFNRKDDGKNLFQYLNVNPEQSTKEHKEKYPRHATEQNNSKFEDSDSVIKFQKCKSYAEIFEITKSVNENHFGHQEELRTILRQQEIDEITYLKIETYLSLIVLTQFRKKRNSCRLNLEVLKIKIDESKEVSEQDRHRLELLELLKVQLDKKIFIQTLKHYRLYKICVKVLSNIFEFDDEQEVSIQKSEKMWESNEADSLSNNKKLETVQEIHKEKFYHKNLLQILTQTLFYIFNKTTYVSFQILKEFKSAELIDHKDEIEEQENEIEPSFEQRENPIEAIKSYIKELRREITQESTCNQDVLRNYFIKWKVFFLNNMIGKIQEDQISSTSNAKMESDEEMFTEISSKKKLKSSLKGEKRELKQFLEFSRRCEFYKHFGEMKAEKEIKLITNVYYSRNLLKKAMTGFELNKNEEINIRDTEEYADYVADHQNEEEMMTAEIFENTNSLAKAFFGFKNYLKCSKISRKMLFLLIKYCFHQIRFKNNNEQENEQKVERFLERKRKMTIFKYFLAFKNLTSFSNEKEERIQNFIMKRNEEIVSVCFSVISLEWKKKLILAKKLQTFLEISSISKFFEQCEHIRNEKYERQAVQIETIFHVQNIRKNRFFVNLKRKYFEGLKNRALEVKSVKLEIEKMKSFAQKGLKDWRKKVLCHKNYSIVGKKLLKLKELEQKEKIFRIWQKRLLEKIIQGRKDRKTNDHKIWLNKYLEKLHALEDEE